MKKMFLAATAIMLVFSCERIAVSPDYSYIENDPLSLSGMARILSSLPMEQEHLDEVHEAVSSSSGNGYDEEYMMRDLFTNPGAGVGDDVQTKSACAESYSNPLNALIRDYLEGEYGTKSEDASRSADALVSSLASSSMQIFWPNSEEWDGKTLPVITFDPLSEASINVGYEMLVGEDGSRYVREIMVDEEMASERPVWVVNDNDDSSYTSLEMLRRKDPDWGKGGTVIVKSGDDGQNDFRTLVLKDFKMNRHYDSWFRGASEFFVKCGSVQGFTASTEAELKLYQPSVTDFMIVVKRKQLGQAVPFNAVLISEWSDQLDNFAFMIIEDDGGSMTSWKVDATVKLKSKSYGLTIDIPYRQNDDIVWRGSLSSSYFEKYDGSPVHFGGVDVTFSLY